MFRFYILLSALLLSSYSAMSSTGETCSNNPSICADERLCNLSTTSIKGKTVWETIGGYQKFVDEAKKRNLICNVDELASFKYTTGETCSNNPSICADERLCILSTTFVNGKTVWETSGGYQKFVDEAKNEILIVM